MRSLVALVAFAWSLLGADAFLAPAAHRTCGRRSGLMTMAARTEKGTDRRQAMAATSLWSVAALGLVPQLFTPPAQAAVGEGGLPEAAEAFSRILRTQKDFAKVAKTIADREGKLEDQEWVNTQIFLRNAFLIGNDFRRLVRDGDSDKRAKGNALASDYETVNKEMDRLCKTPDQYKTWLADQEKVQSLFKGFLDLISDVPDEL